MTDQRKSLAQKAAAAALSIRLANGYALTESISVFDLALKLGIELRFQSLASLEGMYSPTPVPAIVIGTERPAPRQVYTCAHEIAHHFFAHGTKVDHYVEFTESNTGFDEEEFLAQSFAGFLLIPKVAFQNQIRKRNIVLERITPEELYRIANYFGVGFQSILNHLHYSLRLIEQAQYDRLRKTTLPSIRSAIVGFDLKEPLVCADEFWEGIPIDLEVGDRLLVPNPSTFEGRSLVSNTKSTGITLYHAVTQGKGRILNSSKGWAAFVRVRPKNYTGRAIFRHLDSDD